MQPPRLTAACRAEPISAAWQFLPLAFLTFVYAVPGMENDAGYNSAAVNGTGSVTLLPMKPHCPDGGAGDELAGVGVLLGL